jgi:hypothetical protein
VLEILAVMYCRFAGRESTPQELEAARRRYAHHFEEQGLLKPGDDNRPPRVPWQCQCVVPPRKCPKPALGRAGAATALTPMGALSRR